MNAFKVAAVTPGEDGFLNVWLRDGCRAPVTIPVRYRAQLRPGMTLHVYKNRAGHDVAYCFGGYMYVPNAPITRASAVVFADGIRDLSDFSLDSVRFKKELNRSLRSYGMTPTKRLVTDVLVFGLCHQKSKTR